MALIVGGLPVLPCVPAYLKPLSWWIRRRSTRVKRSTPASFVRRYDALWHLEPADIPIGLAGCHNRDGMTSTRG